jgi:hypothetical protein
MITTDKEPKTKIHLEDEISRIIMMDNGCTCHFEYNSYNNTKYKIVHDVTVTTYNPATQETFLLKNVTQQPTEEICLEKVLSFLQSHNNNPNYSSFTIEWKKKGGLKNELSHFYAKNMKEAIEKFFFEKDENDYIIYLAKLNPES